jgi:hypothetical protein
MRRSSRTIILVLAALAVAATGCGGSDVDADEVPGAPPALTVPSDSELESGGADEADAEATATPEESSDEAVEPDAATEDPAAATEPVVPEETADPSGGAAAPESQAAAPEEDTTEEPAQPPADSPPEQFESFCEQNAGAC